MKPGRFEYLAPTTLDEALEMLAERGEEATVLAGGQSLIPAMNFRLATPAALVDLNRAGGLADVYVDGDDLVVEALVRHRALEDVATGDPLNRLMARMSRFVGHLPIRERGTFVGSIAHADPAAEWCVLAAALDATIVVRSKRGERRIRAAEFFEGPFTTARTPDEIITAVRVPLLGSGGIGFQEKSQTAGDFATVATMATLRIEDGVVVEAHLGVAGAEGRPVRCERAEESLVGAGPEPGALAAAAHVAAENVAPISDALCSADYRRHLVEVLMGRALRDATRDAAA
jgi:carbon-monoxide dehydrogenase medium subunit